MNIIYFLVPASLAMGLLFLGLFIWNNKTGQYEDLDTPPIRILNDEPTGEHNADNRRK